MISDTPMMFPFLSMKDQLQQFPSVYTNINRYRARYLLFIGYQLVQGTLPSLYSNIRRYRARYLLVLLISASTWYVTFSL